MKVVKKAPDERLDYEWAFGQYLTDGDTISDKTVTSDDPTVDVTSVAESSGNVVAWIEGGRLGTTAQVTCRVTTVAGRRIDGTISVLVRER